MAFFKQNCGVLLTALAVVMSSIAPAQAKKPDNPGGGNGGGDGGGNQLELIDLHPTGSTYSQASAINNSGIVVGSVDDVAGYWDTTATSPTFTALSGGNGLFAKAINESGSIVGDGAGPTYWASPSATPVSLPLPPGYTNGSANGISRDGIVIGEVYGGSSNAGAVAWRVIGSTVFGPEFLPNASSVNDVASLQSVMNRAVGRSDGGPGEAAAKAWDLELHPDGTFSVTSSTILIPGEPSVAYAITERGDVSGQVYGDPHGADLDATEDNAFVIRNDSLKLLKAGSGNREGIGFDLNDTDVVGGTAPYYWTPVRYATLWNSHNQPEDLSAAYFGDNWSQAVAYSINDDGDIVGFGTYEGAGHAWLLRTTPSSNSVSASAPEPSSCLILAALSVAMAGARKKRTTAMNLGKKKPGR
jgi:uncharacterized membrane protein